VLLREWEEPLIGRQSDRLVVRTATLAQLSSPAAEFEIFNFELSASVKGFLLAAQRWGGRRALE
jgi:hypothetical protein